MAPIHKVLQLPWRRARAWCLPPIHLLLHTVASAASVCQFVAPASHPSLAALHGFSVGGAACLPPAVALEVRKFVWGRGPAQPASMHVSIGTQDPLGRGMVSHIQCMSYSRPPHPQQHGCACSSMSCAACGQAAHAAGRTLCTSASSAGAPTLCSATLGAVAWLLSSPGQLIICIDAASGSCHVAASAGVG